MFSWHWNGFQFQVVAALGNGASIAANSTRWRRPATGGIPRGRDEGLLEDIGQQWGDCVMSICARLITLFFVLPMAGAAWAQATGERTKGAPEQRPFLRIEAGTHTSFIQAIGLSRDERRMVTGSTDKTVRVWRLPEGRL